MSTPCGRGREAYNFCGKIGRDRKLIFAIARKRLFERNRSIVFVHHRVPNHLVAHRSATLSKFRLFDAAGKHAGEHPLPATYVVAIGAMGIQQYIEPRPNEQPEARLRYIRNGQRARASVWRIDRGCRKTDCELGRGSESHDVCGGIVRYGAIWREGSGGASCYMICKE